MQKLHMHFTQLCSYIAILQQIITLKLSMYEKLSHTCRHRYKKYWIVGLNLYKCEYIMAWKTKQCLGFKYIKDYKLFIICQLQVI